MKKLPLIILFLLIGVFCQAQINTRHLFGSITKNDIQPSVVVKSLKVASTSTAVFLRLALAETAFEIPLKKGGINEGQYFKASGAGVSFAFYKLQNEILIERFTLNVLLFTPNNNPGSNLSNALTIGVPIPKLDLPILNAGVRYDWKARTVYLQTGITLEF